MTSEDFQRYVRNALYIISGALTSYGFTGASSKVEASAGIVLMLANLAWSIWGMRLAAKVAELGKIAKDPTTPVLGVVTAPTPEGVALAASVPGPQVVVAGTSGAAAIARAA